MKKKLKFCERCKKDTTFKVGIRMQRAGSREGRYSVQREFDNCMFCGWSERKTLNKVKK